MDPRRNPGLSGIWPSSLILPPARNEHEQALARSSIHSTFEQALFSGRLVSHAETGIFCAMINESDLSRLGYRCRTTAEREDAASLVTKLSDSASAAFLGRVSLAIIQEHQHPGTINWRDCSCDFESSWEFIKQDFFSDNPEFRSAARALAVAVLNPLRLPNSDRGEVRIVSESFKKDVKERYSWSCELDHVDLAEFR